MWIDAEAFPIVRLRYDRDEPAGKADNLDVLADLLNREQPFVLIGSGTHVHDESREQRKRIVLWLKHNRARLTRLVRALVYVEPDSAQRLVARPAAFLFEKFWGFPMIISESPSAALALATALLDRQRDS